MIKLNQKKLREVGDVGLLVKFGSGVALCILLIPVLIVVLIIPIAIAGFIFN